MANQNTQFIFNNSPHPHPPLPPPEKLAVYEVMWKNTVPPDRPQIKI